MKVGEQVPNFILPDETGREVTLEELLEDGPIVLFFYPRAFTTGCTAESCHFRDAKAEILAAGGHPVGISSDPVERQFAFSEQYTLGYPLLSDPDKAVAAHFGVRRNLPIGNKRMTFVIDTDRTVRGVLKSEINMDLHADQAIEILKSMGKPD